MYCYVCPGCGAHLDPGEPCEDCREKKIRNENKAAELKKRFENDLRTGEDGQIELAI